MLISEYINNRTYEYDTETHNLTIDPTGEYPITIDANGIKSLMNMFKFMDDNKLV